MPDEDFEAARKAYEGPKKFAEVLREAGTRASLEHRQFEAALKVRRKDFEQQVEQYKAKLAVVESRSDIVKREIAVAEVRIAMRLTPGDSKTWLDDKAQLFCILLLGRPGDECCSALTRMRARRQLSCSPSCKQPCRPPQRSTPRRRCLAGDKVGEAHFEHAEAPQAACLLLK